MSHFLERVAASVTKPTEAARQPALRPLLGSIYAPAGAPLWTHAADAQSFSVEEERTESSAGEKHESAARRVRREELVETKSRTEHAESEAWASQRATRAVLPESSLRHEVLLPALSAEAQSLDSRDEIPAARDDAGPVREGRESASPLQREAPGAMPDLRTVVDLLMRPSARETAAHSPGPQTTSGRLRTTNREPERRAAQPAREPDEITINIGRVEVTAVQQPAARPAAAPARRSVSLDEYLKRGSGRAR